jgi:ABC-type uncharacterized transport system ATPase subunit
MTEPISRDRALALALRGIDKRYGSTQALASASLEVRPGTVHALLGENGAGKTTMMRIAYGLERADAGSIEVHGAAVRLTSATDAIAFGIGMVHQHFTLVPVMTVAENLALGEHGTLDLTHVASRVQALSRETGFALDPAARIESLSVGAQQRVEIAKALVRNAGILILDEPTAVLVPTESVELLRWLRTYADEGNTVVLITHKLREALSVADDVTVLRRGRTALTATRAETTPEKLTDAMIGSVMDEGVALQKTTASATTATAPSFDATHVVAFRADRITLTDSHGIVRIRDATFTISMGEIVGIAGVEGSGQRELLRALAGRLPLASGTLTRPASVGFVPEDRHHDAVLLDRSLAENVALRGAGARSGTIDWDAIHTLTDALLRAFDVRATGTRALMRSLSGGNQQKLVLARELRADGTSNERALVVESPTRGLDVRATADVHARLRMARDDGAAVVLYSSDIDEVLLLASRVLIVYGGTVREVLVDRDAIGRAMLGVE